MQKQELLSLLKKGSVIIAPTDSVFGIMCNLSSESAIKELYTIKQRSLEQPTAVLVNSLEMVQQYTGTIPKQITRLLESLWPGSLTIILPTKPLYTSLAQGENHKSLAFRMPDYPFLLEIIKKLGSPLVASSANRKGQPILSTLQEIQREFSKEVDAIVDDPAFTPHGIASTIVDFTSGKPIILREGTLSANHIKELL